MNKKEICIVTETNHELIKAKKKALLEFLNQLTSPFPSALDRAGLTRAAPFANPIGAGVKGGWFDPGCVGAMG